MADELLKKAGYTRNGLPRPEDREARKQYSFERSIISTPMGKKKPKPGIILRT